MKFVFWLFVGAIGILVMHPAFASAALEEQCERLWITESGSLPYLASDAGRTALVNQWKLRESECRNTAVYWGRLAAIQALNKDLIAARTSLGSAPKDSPDKYRYAVDFAAAVVAMQERLASPSPLRAVDVAEFEKLFSAVVKKHPGWPPAYGMLGAMQTLQGKHALAIKNLRVALSGDAYQRSGVYRNLTISLTSLGRFAEAAAASDRFAELNENALADADFAISAAISHTELGDAADARDILRGAAIRNPAIVDDPDYVKALELVMRKLGKVSGTAAQQRP